MRLAKAKATAGEGPALAARETSRRAVLAGAAAMVAAPRAFARGERLTPASELPRGAGPVRYVEPGPTGLKMPRVMIKGAGATLDGVDCSGCYVSIEASGVTLRNCRFTALEGAAIVV